MNSRKIWSVLGPLTDGVGFLLAVPSAMFGVLSDTLAGGVQRRKLVMAGVGTCLIFAGWLMDLWSRRDE